MGLDMYLHGSKFHTSHVADETDEPSYLDGKRVRTSIVDLGYWRKHPNLHGYIVETFASGIDECQEIPLNEDQLEQIAKAIEERKLPHTEGFFFGSSEDVGDVETKADAQTFREAKEFLRRRDWTRSVYYRASW